LKILQRSGRRFFASLLAHRRDLQLFAEHPRFTVVREMLVRKMPTSAGDRAPRFRNVIT
jgi:hypothetical protein